MLDQLKAHWESNGTLPDLPFKVARANREQLDQLYPNIENPVGKLWLYLHGKSESAIICERSGRSRRFMNFDTGPLKFCGNQSVCPCNADNFQSKISQRDENRKKEINNKRANTNKKKYGHEFASQSDVIKSKAAATCLLRYGTISPTQNPDILSKSRATCLSNHGVEYPQQDGEILARSNSTFIKRYGVTRPAQDETIREKAKQTMLDRYGVTYAMHLPEIAERVRYVNRLTRYTDIVALRDGFTPLFTAEEYANSRADQPLRWLCHACGGGFEQVLIPGSIRCPQCDPVGESWGEKEVRRLLESHGIGFSQNDRRVIPPLELDFFIPSLSLAIEFNGIYWHSEKILSDRMYHRKKFTACKNAGIKLIQIFEHELANKPHIVMDRLYHALKINRIKIGARSCKIRAASNQETRTFFDQNHLQSNRPSNQVWVLEHDDKIVAALSMGKARYSKRLAQWELLRYATLEGHTIPGGLSRLFNRAVADLGADSVVTYADLAWGEGLGYQMCGFKLLRYSDPAPWYFKNADQVHSRIKFQKHRLNNPNQLSESDWARENGYNRFWDVGNAVWVWTRPLTL